MRTEELFDMLNALYTAFDDLVDRHGVHKVDTIGDGERRGRERESARTKEETETLGCGGGWAFSGSLSDAETETRVRGSPDGVVSR